jgi:glycine/D-amino acid oxidase-like deaminating enzyme
MNMDLIEDAFCVTEYAFDANGLREVLRASLDRCNVRVSCATSVERVSPYEDGRVLVHLENGTCVNAGRVFNCAYSSINDLLRRSELPLLPLKYELAEVALVAVPEQLASVAFTVMDGPFFSTMPFPARKLHSLTHVRYTPHRAWSDASAANDGREPQATSSRYLHMVKDAQRYVPALRHSRYVDSLFEVKSLLIQHEVDDGRPILFRNHYGIENFCIIMGSKLDNIYDALSTLRGVGLLEEVKNGAGA